MSGRAQNLEPSPLRRRTAPDAGGRSPVKETLRGVAPRPATPDAPPASQPPPPAARSPVPLLVLQGLLVIAVLALAGLGAVALLRTGPQARHQAPQPSATPVRTRIVESSTTAAHVDAMGTVMAAREVVLRPQISGAVVRMSPAMELGGRVRGSEVLLVIDPAEYEVGVRQAQAALARSVARRQSAAWELERLEGLRRRDVTNKKELDDAHTARAVAEADVSAAQAALEKAELDLARTTIRAPFDGLVTAESVDLGAQVTPQAALATLVGTAEYWVQVSVPVSRLDWLILPGAEGQAGSPVEVHQQLGGGLTAQWPGTVVRLLGDLEPRGRMARLLVAVRDPLLLESKDPARTPLLIGSYVDVAIEGRRLADVIVVGREEIRDGDRVWIMNDEQCLDIRAVTIAFRGRDQVLVTAGLTTGERLITSDLAAPVAGMRLRALSEGPATPPPAPHSASSSPE